MLKRIRNLHLYLGIFFAPAIVFFSVSGALQTFGLHEMPPGSSFQTPSWLAVMAQLHKKQSAQIFKRPERSTEPPGNGAIKSETARDPQNSDKESGTPGRPKLHSSLALKWFVVIMAVGLITNVFSGIYMAFAYNRNRKAIIGLLLAGIVLPTIFLLM